MCDITALANIGVNAFTYSDIETNNAIELRIRISRSEPV